MGQFFELSNNKTVLPFFTPLHRNKFNTSIFMLVDLSTFLKSTLKVLPGNNKFKIKIIDNKHEYFKFNEKNTNPQLDKLEEREEFTLFGHSFQLIIAPSMSLISSYFTMTSVYIFIIGLVFSILLALLIYFQKQLEQTQKRNLLILESAGEGIYGLDLEGTTSFVNPAGANLVGWSSTEIIGKKLHDLVHFKKIDGSPYPFSECPVFGTLSTGQKEHRDNEVFWRKDGSYFYAEYTSRPIMEYGKITGAVITCKDNSLSITHEHEIQLQKIKLQTINKELESFSYSVSHDLRVPLRHISGYIQFLKAKVTVFQDPEVNHYIKIITQECLRMEKLIEDLLAFSRAGRFALNKQKINFITIIETIISSLSDDIQNRSIKWQIGPLPDVFVDASMFRIVWDNLISNAIKFTRTRKKAVISIDCHDLEDEYIFCIKDNGVGFDMSYVDKIFDVFQRLHPDTEFEGVGIGLANVQRIVDRHEGRVWATGEVGKGAQFYFTIPKLNYHESNLVDK